jgi:hypothetical protein
LASYVVRHYIQRLATNDDAMVCEKHDINPLIALCRPSQPVTFFFAGRQTTKIPFISHSTEIATGGLVRHFQASPRTIVSAVA